MLEADFAAAFGKKPELLVRAPGHVILLGDYLETNSGSLLSAAIDREVSLAAASGPEGIVSLRSVDLDARISFRLQALESRVELHGEPLPSWARHPAGVAWALKEARYKVAGLQAAFSSNIPMEAGLGSSAAVEIAFALAWRLLGGWQADGLTVARLCQRAEIGYLGEDGSLVDLFTSACGVASHIILFDARNLAYERLPLPAGTALMIADSGIRCSQSVSAYTERQEACQQAVELLRRYKPSLRSLRDLSSVEFAAYGEYLPPVIRKRAEHIVKEMARVDQAVLCLRGGDAHLFGGLMYASHASLRNSYEVGCPELDLLVRISRNIPGCFGTRMVGAGFGGCTVSLVEEAQAPAFIQGLHDEYLRQAGREAAIYFCRASNGASLSA